MGRYTKLLQRLCCSGELVWPVLSRAAADHLQMWTGRTVAHE